MIAEAHKTVRNAGWLLVQRSALIIGGVLFAVLIPRLMGPEIYGQYALLVSLALWCILAGTLGFAEVISRYMPPLFFAGDASGVKKLFANLLTVRLVSAASMAGLYLLITGLWLRDLDPWALGFVACYVFVRTISELYYLLFLGLNQAARRGMGELLSRWVTLLALPIGFYLGGLRGACLGLFLSEAVVLAIGVGWARRYVSWTDWRFNWRYLSPFLHFGLLFFASGFVSITARRTGEPLVKLISGDYVQVGYYGLAFNTYMMIALIIPTVVQSFVPLFTAFWERGRPDQLGHWVERLLGGLTALCVLILFGALLLGPDLVLIVFGAEYRPVAANLVPLTFGLLVVPLSSIARALCVVSENPKLALATAVIQLATFWGLAAPLIAWQGSLGACVALAGAEIVSGGYFTWRVQKHVRYSLRPWGVSILLSGLFLPLVHFRSSWMNNAGLYIVFLIGYGGLMVLFRVTRLEEIFTIWRFARPVNTVDSRH